MATFSWSMAIVKRSEGRSVVAAAAYYAREALTDHRTGQIYDYRDRGDLEHREILLPPNAPAWCRDVNREELWNKCEEREVRRDAQLARSLRIMIPREFTPEDRVRVVRDYLNECFVSKGMLVDASWHNPPAGDGGMNPHCHALITMRHLSDEGFGPKSRHYMVPDSEGRTQPDGSPVLVISNKESWNSPVYFETCREKWEQAANAELERIGSQERIDRRSLLARGISRLPEPALRLAYHLKDLYGVMSERWGQFLVARHYKSVERRANDAFRKLEAGSLDPAEKARQTTRFYYWIERQVERLTPDCDTARDMTPHSSPEIER